MSGQALPIPPQYRVPEIDSVNGGRVRCFVTGIKTQDQTRNLYAAIVSYRADHASLSGFEGSFSTTDGRAYELGQVIWVTVER